MAGTRRSPAVLTSSHIAVKGSASRKAGGDGIARLASILPFLEKVAGMPKTPARRRRGL
jgi:hypothetical protein